MQQHPQPEIRLRRALLMTLAVLLALLMLTPPSAGASTDSGPLRYGEKIDVVGGAWFTTTPTTFSDLTIRIFDRSEKGNLGNSKTNGPALTLFYVLKETNPSTNEVTRTEYEGFVPDAGAEFIFNGSLKGASADMDVELYGYRCIEEGPQGLVGSCVELDPITVNVDLTWSGIGEIVRNSDGDSFNFPGFKFQSHTVDAYRSADLIGTVSGDGVVLASGPASFGVMLRGKYHERLLIK